MRRSQTLSRLRESVGTHQKFHVGALFPNVGIFAYWNRFLIVALIGLAPQLHIASNEFLLLRY